MAVKPQTFLLCMGTRPEIIKMAPVYHELARRGARLALLHTGQHQDMADPMYDFFGMNPDYSLRLNRTSNTLEHLSALLVEKIGQVLTETKPRTVLVHGDTTSALMAALAAFYHKIPVAHVEAGLRSHDDYDPFPEEKNRELVARLARWHFAPTAQAVANLAREGISGPQVRQVGNTVVDAVLLGQEQIRKHSQAGSAPASEVSQEWLEGRKLILVTAHRRENWEAPLLSISKAVLQILHDYPDTILVWPVHANPAVKRTVHAVLGKLPAALAERIRLTVPLSYPAMLDLLTRAWLVLTDSGGIQEEAASLHVPILVLRETTERPELIEVGAGRLVGTQQQNIAEAVDALWRDPRQHAAMRAAPNPFGDGSAARQIVDALFERPAKS